MYLQSTNAWCIRIFAARVLAGAPWASTRCWSFRISWITLDHSQSSEQAPIQGKRAVHFLNSVNSLYKTISAKQMFDLFDGFWGTWNFAVLISFSALRFRLHPEFPDRCKASTNVLPLPTDTHTQTHNSHTHTHVYIHVITVVHTCTVSWHRSVTRTVRMKNCWKVPLKQSTWKPLYKFSSSRRAHKSKLRGMAWPLDISGRKSSSFFVVFLLSKQRTIASSYVLCQHMPSVWRSRATSMRDCLPKFSASHCRVDVSKSLRSSWSFNMLQQWSDRITALPNQLRWHKQGTEYCLKKKRHSRNT